MSAPTVSSGPTPPQKKRAGGLVRVLGFGLVIISLGFVGQRLHRQLGDFTEQFREVSWGLMLLAVVGFSVSQLLLSSGWYLLLRWQGGHTLRLSESHVLCGQAQIAKYIPGNIFQFVARHLAFRRLGISDGALVLATAYETLSFVVAAGILAALGLPFYAEEATALSPRLAVLVGAVAVFGLLVLVRYGRRLLQLVGRAPPPGIAMRPSQVLSVVPLYAAFVACSGSLALILFRTVGGDPDLGIIVISAYSLAWLSGYIVPGASGGLGVREATLLVLLGDTPEALFVSLGMRVITTLGEVMWFAASSLVAQLQHSKT